MAKYVFKIAPYGNPCGAPQIPVYAEKPEMIVVHLPTGRKDGQSFSELRLETPAHHGLATSANLGSLYRPQRTAGMDQAPLFEYPLFPPGWHSECRFLSRGSSPKELPNVQVFASNISQDTFLAMLDL